MANLQEETKKRIALEIKTKYDRGNFFLASQALFANAFATLVVGVMTTDKIVGWYAGLPIIICFIGVFLNIAWVSSNRFKEDELKKELKSTNGFKDDELKEVKLTDIINKAVPYILIGGWLALMLLFTAQYYGLIKIPTS